jgi:alpha-glucosidase (family GH31 glycosyl hydrolase)
VRETDKHYILTLIAKSASSGEPVVRSMEYVFPHQGYANVNDQFMLGDQILVAPVLQNGTGTREVIIPTGSWRAFNGKLYQGPAKLSLTVKDDELCYFERAETATVTARK